MYASEIEYYQAKLKEINNPEEKEKYIGESYELNRKWSNEPRDK